MNDRSAVRLVTYAQNREDLYLWAMLAQRTPGTYVDVGCNHERLHSVTRLFYEQGWAGLNIDANDGFRAEYEYRTRDRFIATGVGAESGKLVFRTYPRQDGLSTFDQTIKDLHLESGYAYEEDTIDVRTLDDILDSAGIDAIDFLKIDVEGLEPDVLRGLDLTRRRPAVIVLEASRQEACDLILLPNRYHHEFFDGLNSYYVDDDVNDVTIHHYAGRVLQAGFLTDLEVQLQSGLPTVSVRAALRERASSSRERFDGARSRLIEAGSTLVRRLQR